MPAPSRSPEEIRASIEQNRVQLGHSLEKLRYEVGELMDWRSQLRLHRRDAMIGAAVTGFVIGGGIAALATLAFGKGRRRQGRR